MYVYWWVFSTTVFWHHCLCLFKIYMRSGIGLKPFINFFVDRKTTLATALGTGWKDTALGVNPVFHSFVVPMLAVRLLKYRCLKLIHSSSSYARHTVYLLHSCPQSFCKHVSCWVKTSVHYSDIDLCIS